MNPQVADALRELREIEMTVRSMRLDQWTPQSDWDFFGLLENRKRVLVEQIKANWAAE